MSRTTSEKGGGSFDLNDESWEEAFSKADRERFDGDAEERFSTGAADQSWLLFSEKLRKSEDDRAREETNLLGQRLSRYSAGFTPPDWETFKDKLEVKIKQRRFFFISQAAEIYLLLAFCALLTYWGTRTGLFLKESHINWDKITAYTPFSSSSGVLSLSATGLSYHSKQEKRNTYFIADNSAERIPGKALSLFLLIPPAGSQVEENRGEKAAASFLTDVPGSKVPAGGGAQEAAEEDQFTFNETLPGSRHRAKISPYVKLNVAGSLAHVNTPLVSGSFNRGGIIPGAGIEAGVEWGEKWSVAAGVNYQKVTYDGVTASENTTAVLSVPVRVEYRIVKTAAASVYVLGGFSSNHIIAGSYEDLIHVPSEYANKVADYLENPEDVKRAIVVNDNTKVQDSYASLAFGVGLERKIGSAASLFANAVYSASLGKGFGQNFEKMSSLGVELGVKLLI